MLRETGYFSIHWSSVKQFLFLRGTSVTCLCLSFQCLLVSTSSLHSMECLLFIDTPEESGIGVVSSMQEEQCISLEGHLCSSNRLVRAYCVLGVGALLVTMFICRLMIINGKVIWIITLLFLFVRKSRTILNSVMIMIKTEVVCWLCHHELINSINLFVTGTHCILQEKWDFAFPLFLGNTPSNVCQDFDICLVG
jgi:hypothetical protein